MVQITDSAAVALSQVRSSRCLPEHYGVRLYSPTSNNGQNRIQIGFTEHPGLEDEVTETAGVRLFVAPEVSEPLDGYLLDAVESDDGVNIVLREA